MQAAGADIFGLFIDAGCEFGDHVDRVIRYVQLYAFRFKQRDVLLDQGILRFGENADEIFFLQRLQLHANRQAALQLRNQVRRLGDMEGASGDEQDVVRADHSVPGFDRSAVEDGQDVAAHTVAWNVRSV